jgi:ribonuclease H / adenosylcobalamin/alpha-ribazole phosphatase
MSSLIVYTDGASQGNPGPGWAMWVIGKLQKRKRLARCTNNEAEYLAVVYALEELISQPKLFQGYEKILFQIDSKLVVEQLNGRWKIKDARMRQ